MDREKLILRNWLHDCQAGKSEIHGAGGQAGDSSGVSILEFSLKDLHLMG